jgi:FSR family fosmidomycin resistance protein-like MFS transporter
MSFFTEKKFLAINLDHVIVDIYIGERAVLFTYIATQLGKTNTWLGLMTMLGLMAGGLAQPFFGWVVDKGGFKWIVIGGLAWMILFYAAAAIFPISLAPIFIILAMFGSAAFHPAGSFHAQRTGKSEKNGQETTATALFFLFGNFGFVIGPLVGGFLLTLQGMLGSLWFAAGAVPLLVYSLWVFLSRGAEKGKTDFYRTSQIEPIPSENRAGWYAIPVVFLVILMQAWAQQNIYVFIPKHLSDLGYSATIYGIVAAVIMAGSALGNLLGGIFADRKDRRAIVVFSLLLSCIPVLLLTWIPFSGIWYFLVFASGFGIGISYSVLIVMAQKTITLPPAMTSGIVLGWVFMTGAVGTQISGVIADRTNFAVVYLITAAMVVIGGLLAFFLRGGRSGLPE